MTKNKDTMKAHIAAGLDITAPVTLVLQGGRPGVELGTATGMVSKNGKFWTVRDADGKCLQNGGGGAKFIFVY